MEIGSQVKAVFEIPEYAYYIIGVMIVTHFGSLIAFFGVIIKWIVEYKIQARDIKELRDQMSTANATIAKTKADLDVAHERIREIRGVR